VDCITGVRLVPLEGQKAMRVEYRIKWKDDVADSWHAHACALPSDTAALACTARPSADARARREPARNVAEDVLKEFEARWWASARKGDAADLTDMLAGGREVLATTVDDNGRTCVALQACCVCACRRC
jgi:hypothetical protein